MRCRQARPLLPALVDEAPDAELERHLSSCTRCSAELAGYRSVASRMSALDLDDLEAPAGYLERMLLEIPVGSTADRLPLPGHARAARYALASIGGVALGAGAIGIVWWRLAHRAVHRAAGGTTELTGTAKLAAS